MHYEETHADTIGAFDPNEGKINLYNFEDERYGTARYVLTSPRSLEACMRKGVKPAELLYKPLAEFQNELHIRGVSLRNMYDKYDLHEQDRQQKLRACRTEREKVLLEKFDAELEADSLPTQRFKTGFDKVAHPWDNGGSRESNVEEEHLVCAESLHRKHTALTPLQGTLDDDWQGLRRRQSCTKDHLLTSSPDVRHPSSDKGNVDDEDDDGELALSRSLSSMDIHHRTSGSINSSGYNNAARLSLSYSLTSPDRQPVRMTSAQLRRALGCSYTADNVSVTRKDHKIFEAMLSKKREEQKLNKLRSQAEMQWEEERCCLLSEQAAADEEKGRFLAEKQRAREAEQAEEQQRRLVDEETWRSELERKAFLNDLKSSRRVCEVKDAVNQQIQEKVRRDRERKSNQEEACQRHDKQWQCYAEGLMSRSAHELMKATHKKEEQLDSEMKRKRRHGRRRSCMHRARYSMIRRRSESNLADLRASIGMKHSRGERNHASVLHSRDFSLQMKNREESEKRAKSEERLERLNREKEAWNQELLRHRYHAEARASETAQMTMQTKVNAVRRSRETKKRQQTNVLQSLQHEDEARQWQHASHIAIKEWRAQAAQHKKDTEHYKVRSMAASAQKLREDLKKQYGGDTFDKKVKEVELQSRVGFGIKSAARNVSTVTLA